MNKKTLVLSAAIAGLVLGGAKIAQAEHHEGGDATKTAEAGKDGCKGKDACKGHAKKKSKKKGAKDECKGKDGCGGEKKEEAPANAAPATGN
jgi:hypothetical protein